MTSYFKAKSRIRKSFKNCNPHKEHYVRIFDSDTYFYERYKKEIKLDLMDREYII